MVNNSINAPADVIVKLKKRRRRRRGKMKPKNGDAVLSMDQKDENVEDFQSGKNGMTAENCSQDTFPEADLASKLSQEHKKSDTVSTTNPVEKSAKSKKKKKKRAKKKAGSKPGLQSMDQSDVISNLSLADTNDGSAGGKTDGVDICLEFGQSTGKGSAISLSSPLANFSEKDGKLVNNDIASASSLFNDLSHNIGPQSLQKRVESGLGILNKEVSDHRSSEVINNAQTYRIPQRRRSIYPRRKLLILDVNGLLVDIVMPPPRECKADTNMLGRAIFKRPFYYDFLKFCFERFDVGIWSSRSSKIIDKVVHYLLGDLKHKLLFCWDMVYCTDTQFRALDNRYKPMVLKELRKLWEKHDPNLPWEKGDYDESNTLLVDDSPYKALLNPMHNGVFPCSYSYKDRSDNSLGPGGDLRVYLEGLATAESVKNYIAQHPFGQGSINESDPYWTFYSRVLQSLSIQSDEKVLATV